jgi:mandelate racemase
VNTTHAKPEIKVTRVRTRVVRVPLARPLVARVVTLDSACYVLVDLETDAGITGHAYVNAFPANGARILQALIELIASAVAIGQPLAPAALYDAAMQKLGLWVGKEGIFSSALAPLDMAAWDALAKAAGQSLGRLLGGTVRELPAYNSTGLGLLPAERLGDEALDLLGDRFGAVKMRLGNETLSQDLAAVRAIKRAIPADAVLMSDFGQSLDANEGLVRCRALDGEGLYWIEDPVPHDDLVAHARIADEISTALQTGENLYGPAGAMRLIAAKGCDYVNFDLGHIGGVTGWLRTAALAAEARLPVSSHVFPEFSAQLLTATPTAHWLEYFDWAAPLLEEPLKVAHGKAIVPDRPGAGIEWDEAAVARYQI